MKVILVILASLYLICFPVLIILALNTLLNLGIAYSISTYLSVLILFIVAKIKINVGD